MFLLLELPRKLPENAP